MSAAVMMRVSRVTGPHPEAVTASMSTPAASSSDGGRSITVPQTPGLGFGDINEELFRRQLERGVQRVLRAGDHGRGLAESGRHRLVVPRLLRRRVLDEEELGVHP